MNSSSVLIEKIELSVESFFKSFSNPDTIYKYDFRCRIECTNRRDDTIQMVGYRSSIKDGTQELREDESLLINGEQPILSPYEKYVYEYDYSVINNAAILNLELVFLTQKGKIFYVHTEPIILFLDEALIKEDDSTWRV